MATIKMVAARAGVSTATVSRAISNPEQVLPPTRARVREAIEALGYAPNSAAKNLRMLRTSKIVVMVPDVSNPFFSEVLRGAEETAQAAGYAVLLGDTNDNAEREAQYAAMLLRKEADGLIFLGHRMPAALIRIVAEKDMAAPIVNGCDYSPKHGVAGVHIDNLSAASEAVALLLSMGHRRIGIVAGPRDSHITRDRLAGVRRAAAEQSGDLIVVHGDYTIESGARLTTQLLLAADRPTGIFCFSDEMAVGALSAARAAGLVCPKDLSIIGFDDVRYARFMDPPLTTIRQPMKLIGSTAVELLLAILNGGSVERAAAITLPHDLVVRGSTASSTL
ncbi:LacI family DNA-binding transcriptional regulator [Sphingobium sp. AN641]|uniref:LacI family DNA-binding transcriptional regulator n=1 Tax=Sphingobium sp. AN641 TaxID=3133443 RepID=UPI0030C21205